MASHNSSNQKRTGQGPPFRLSTAEVTELLNSKEASEERIRRLLTRSEFADALNLCPHSIQRMEKRGLIRSIRINSRVIRYPISELERLLKEAST
jgi:hypothetical protein